MNGNYISGKWGYCTAKCPLGLPNCKTIGGPQVKALCKFPFTYKVYKRIRSLNKDY